MKWTAVVCDKKVQDRLFKNGEVKIETRSLTKGKNLNSFNVSVVDSNYRHVKILCNGT